MKKIRKVILIFAGIVGIWGTVSLVMMGKIGGLGPLGFLHSWQKEIDKIKAKYSTKRKGEIIFYGASNFSLWNRLEEDFKEYKVQNHAFGGSTDKDLYQYAEQVLYPYSPSVVFFQTGSNDYVSLSGSEEEKIAKCMEFKKKMFSDFHEQIPDAKFVIMSGLLLPGRSKYLDMTLKINEELKKYADTVEYIYFVDGNNLTYDGTELDESLFRKDMIHLNHEGQLLWGNNYIKPAIEQLITEYGLDNIRN